MGGTSSVLREFVGLLLECEGGAVEAVEPNGIEYVVPPSASGTLRIPEFGRLGFGPDLPAGAARVSLEPEWIERFGAVLGERGRAVHMVIHPGLPPVSSPERIVEHALTLHNAVWRLAGTRPVWTRYLILVFRYTAVSDEKRDGILRLGINLSNGSVLDRIADELARAAMEMEPAPPETWPPEGMMPSMWEAARLNALLDRGLPARVGGRLAVFRKGLQRRLDRDLARLHGYYSGLRKEALARVRKSGADLERERLRLEAIAREYESKVADLEQKFALVVEVECIQALDLFMPVHRFDLIVRRRKGERKVHLDWNPVARELEPPICEYSFTAEPGRIVCDDALHLVSAEAHGPCGGCGRAYCRACHPLKCPKCGRGGTQSSKISSTSSPSRGNRSDSTV